MREHRLVRRPAARAHRLEQRGVEPAAMLVRALEVHVRRPAQVRSRLEHGRVAAAGIDPDVEDVGLPAELPAAARGTARAGRDELGLGPQVPLLDSPPVAEDLRHVLDDALVEEQRPARAAVERHDRHAPDALAREHPVGPVGDHVEEPVRAPRRDPAHVVPDGVQRLCPEPVLVERDEPLLGRPEQRGVLAPPAVRVLVAERDLRDEGADSFRCAMIFGLASQTVSPAKCATSGTKRPSSSTGL